MATRAHARRRRRRGARGRRALVALCVAQWRSRRPRRRRAAGARAAQPVAAAQGSQRDGRAAPAVGPGALTAPRPRRSASPRRAPATPGVVEAKTLDGGTHVFKFSELDIEGRLKSPQLVYFLRRVRAEFAAGELGHRTFMREMSETRKESTF